MDSHTWTSAVKEGAHLTQAMVLLGTKNDLRKCFVSDCSGNLQSDGNCWLVKQIPFSLRLGHLSTALRFCCLADIAIVMFADELHPLKHVRYPHSELHRPMRTIQLLQQECKGTTGEALLPRCFPVRSTRRGMTLRLFAVSIWLKTVHQSQLSKKQRES